MSATTYLINLLAQLRIMVAFTLALGFINTSHSFSQETYPLPYKYGDNEFKAYLKVAFHAVKGRKQNISSPTETFVDFTDLNQFDKSGQAKLEIVFSNLEFYQGSHARDLTLIFKVSHSQELKKHSAKSKFSLNDIRGGNKTKGTEKISYAFEKTSSPSINFQWTILDKDGKECGKGIISKKVDVVVSGQNKSSLQAQKQSQSIPQFTSTSSTRSINDNSLSQAAEDEDTVWEQITEKNNEEGYQSYITSSDNKVFTGKYRDKAIERILELRDEKAWEAAQNTNNINSYRKYLDIYGDGKFAREARRRLNKLRGNGKSTTTNTVSKPVVEKPTSKEEDVWKAVVEDGSQFEYERYLSLYPQGKYVKEALENIEIQVRMDPPNTPSQYSLTFSKINYPLKLKEVRIENLPGEVFRPKPEDFIDSSMLTSKRLSYNYRWEEGEMTVNVQSIGIREAYVLMQLNTASPYHFVFEDSLNRSKEILIDPQLEALTIDSIWGEVKSEDTLFIKLQGGKPAYFIRFSRKDNQYSSYEKRLNKHPRYPEVWYLDKRDLLADEEIGSGIFTVALLDSRKLEEIEYKRSTVAVNGGFFLSNISLWWILLPVWIMMVVWILVKYMRNR